MPLRHLNFICSLACICTFTQLSAQTHDQAEIFEVKCSKCHGAHAEGNPAKKGPALNKESVNYLWMEMTDLQGNLSLMDETFSEHAKMEHSMQRLEELGYHVNPKTMAEYIFTNFNKDARKTSSL